MGVERRLIPPAFRDKHPPGCGIRKRDREELAAVAGASRFAKGRHLGTEGCDIGGVDVNVSDDDQHDPPQPGVQLTRR